MRFGILAAALALAACSDSGSSPSVDGGNATRDGGSGGDAVSFDAMIDCSAEITCPTPGNSQYTFCGRILDIETDDAIVEPGAVDLRFYDASELSSSPSTAQPLAVDEVTIDSCGRFRAVDVAAGGVNAVLIVVDDAGTDYVPAITAVEASPGSRVRDITTRAVRTATDEAWAAQGGLPPGNTFGDLGTWIAIFTYGGAPMAGVELVRGVTTVPSDAFYFADQNANRTTITTAEELTGANGTGAMLDCPLQSHSGTGSEPAGCEWPSVLAASLPGMFFVSELSPVVIDSDAPCPAN